MSEATGKHESELSRIRECGYHIFFIPQKQRNIAKNKRLILTRMANFPSSNNIKRLPFNIFTSLAYQIVI